MKIISGTLKGRNIKGYSLDGTRPTMDRVKESLFGMIQNYIKDSCVLDLFAGSGNLGFEAISNGCRLCYFNDYNKLAVKTIKENANIFNVLDKSVILDFDYKKALEYLKDNNILLDIVFLDPPYQKECINDIIDYILINKMLNNGGIIICEINKLYLKDFSNYLDLIKSKSYNDKYILIYKNRN